MALRDDGLPEKMKSIVCHGIRACCASALVQSKLILAWRAGDYRYEDIPTPVAGPGDVIVKVKAVGICASDAKCFEGAPMFWGAICGIVFISFYSKHISHTGDANRVGYCQPPITPGHEFIGEVVVMGEGVYLCF